MCFQKRQFNIFNVYIWYLAFCSELTTGESWNGLVQMEIFFHCYLCMTSSCLIKSLWMAFMKKKSLLVQGATARIFNQNRLESGFGLGLPCNGRLASHNIAFGLVKACTRWILIQICLKVHESQLNSFAVIFQLHRLESLSSPMLKEVDTRLNCFA